MSEIFPINLDSIVIPTASTRVFKDDCMFSFDTALDPQGLDICMTCHQAFSRGEFKYTQMHSEFYDHDIFLNYKKIRKVQKDEEQPYKMIKLEVKETSKNDLFESKYALYNQKLDKSLEYPNKDLPVKVSQAAEAIINATSSAKKEEIMSWEQEIKPCKHSSAIKQNVIADLQLKQCTSCELTENLWICLHCGNLGCGRHQFGGVAGNSHAMTHQKEHPDHAVAVKLGSLSSDIADCYCYSCDDEVKVPNLASLLKTFGIDITNFVRTEKSLTELQIEQNIQWDFKMGGNGDEELKPVFGKGLTGFKNLGNSCYLASALQLLFNIEAFKKAFFIPNGVPLDKILGNLKPYEDLETQMYKLGDGLLSGRYSVPDLNTSDSIKYQRGIKPSGFKTLIGEGHPEFSTMLQQDSFEFWTYLIDKLEKKKVYGQLEKSPTNVLKFVLESKIKCGNCHGVRIRKEITDSTSVPLKVELLEKDANGNRIYKETSINESLDQWCSPEAFEYSCPVCGGTQNATREERFRTMPEYYVVNPQRIVLENWVPTKVTVPIKFEESLNLQKYQSLGLLEGEEEMPDDIHDNSGDDAAGEPKFDQQALNSLFEMGFTENKAKHALYATGNNSAEAAMNWLFEHLEDPQIDQPFEVLRKGGSGELGYSIDDDKLASLSSMGFAEQLSRKALILNNGNMEASVEWLFGNPDDNGIIETVGGNEYNEDTLIKELEESFDNTKCSYKLEGVICHKGTSVHSGHYVAFLKKEIEGEAKWVLFNDEKVVLAIDENLREIETSGYLYVYRKV